VNVVAQLRVIRAGAMTEAGRLDHRGLAAIRLATAGAVGLLMLLAELVLGSPVAVAVTCAWAAAAAVVLASVWTSICPKDAHATKMNARAEDFSRATSDLVLLSAAVASLVAVAFNLADAGKESGGEKSLLIGLVVLSVGFAWATVHTVFLLRYARLYYDEPVGGIDYNSDDPPDYRDFGYLALTIGMTYQVSDTDLTARPIRRAALRHALLSFVFGSVIVAVTINIVASLLNR
jgi:uncharacterized membrane protein